MKTTEVKGQTGRRTSERTQFKKARTKAGKTNGSGLKIIIGSGKKNFSGMGKQQTKEDYLKG